jgi:predicted membrane channel-forming protein YqfA (hemolysin III family)
MVDAGSYLLGAVQLALVVVPVCFAAWRLRGRLLPSWSGAPARLVESVAAVALIIWLSEILGTFGLFYAGTLIAASLLLGLATWFLPGGGTDLGDHPEQRLQRRDGGTKSVTGPAGPETLVSLVVMWAVIAITVFTWAVTTKHALDRGIFNFDSLWYHMPFAVDMVQTHSVVGMHHPETVFTNWFYPQNSELLHGVGILLTGRDTLSLFLNFGWLAMAFLAAYCVGRPYGRGAESTVAAAILLACHTLVVRDPGAAKNDLAAAALLLASIAILIEAWAHRQDQWERWALAAAGLAAGLAAGTRVTGLAMAAALTVAVVVLAPQGKRVAAFGWWFLPALAGGVFWYLRNLVVAGNPIPEVEKLGPISLPHPERLQEGRPDFSIAHYATDTGVWRDYFEPGLHEAFGALWPLVVFGAAAAALLAVFHGRDRIIRWIGAVALVGLFAYLFTPLSAAGAEGEPVGFGINIRYVIPALLAGIVLVPLDRWFDPPELHQISNPAGGKSDAVRLWGLMGGLVLVFLVTNRPDDALHDQARVFALLFVILVVGVPALLLYARSRGTSPAVLTAAVGALLVAVLAIGYPLQRHYLDGRFANAGSKEEQIPGMDLDGAYRWAREVDHARIGLAGTTAGFANYGFYGTDLTNRVLYLGEEGPRGAFNAIPSCSAFRAAVNDADLDYLVTAPFLNFLHPGIPISSPEARWLRGEKPVRPILQEGQVTVWRVDGPLDPNACGSRNAPLRQVPNTPAN